MEIKNTVRVFCAKCKEEIDIVDTDFICSLPGGRALFINAVCPHCEEEREKEKSEVKVKCSCCERISTCTPKLGWIVSPGCSFICDHCSEHLIIERYNSGEALWRTRVKNVIPKGGSYIEVVDLKESRGFNTRIATGRRNENTKQVLAWNLEGENKNSWKYWRYVGEKEWRE